jgi:DNA-binding CsgD family transcriptional regulator
MGLLIDEHCRHQLITLSADEANHSAGSFTYGKNHSYNNSPEEIINVSPRELEILQMLGDGMIAKEIAGKLNIGITTVITHRKNLITKFRVKNTAELIKKAGQLMLI